ncbi:MAG: LysR family transcriptional regulator [Cellvibrionaceae bacterium]
MSKSLPPLNALRAFETSARHLSFKKASEELNVTPSAISQQIKNLEENLGVVLFYRSSSGLSVSKEGRDLLPSLEKAFVDIADAVKAIKVNSKSVIRVTASPTFSANWLVPNLSFFQEKHPEIELQLHSSLDVMNLEESEYDCAVRTYLEKSQIEIEESHEKESLNFKKLFSSEILIACNSALLTNKSGIKSVPEKINQITDFNLIHYKDYNMWSIMLRYMGPEDAKPHEGIVCNDIDGLLKTIQSGDGIGLVDRELYENSIYNGTLDEIFKDESPGKLSFYLVSKNNKSNTAVDLFKKWLISETKSFQGHYVFDQARKQKIAPLTRKIT